MASAAANTGTKHYRPRHSEPERATGAGLWDLVERAQAGETEAFGQVFDATYDTVFRFVYFRVHSRQLAEDLVAEAYLRALGRLAHVTRSSVSPAAWLITIARNLVFDHFKSGRYRLEVLVDTFRDPAYTDTRTTLDAVAIGATDHDDATQLWTAVRDELTGDQRDVLVLRFLTGLSVAETAAAMGREVGAVKALQYRATLRLARVLAGTGLDPRVLAAA